MNLLCWGDRVRLIFDRRGGFRWQIVLWEWEPGVRCNRLLGFVDRVSWYNNKAKSTVRQGLKPLPQSSSPLKRTN